MQTMAITNFSIPGEAGFPLNAMYGKPRDRSEAGSDSGHILIQISSTRLEARYEVFTHHEKVMACLQYTDTTLASGLDGAL
ncbi:Actin-related protein 2/3 complex subunit 3 [Holothuria leucospilota]|uniref:Actin-related protein 2/3 complex subunit 3 n=1 Tax=Holothuria leucospilota TaxID=206669 RepID=A0A9Q1BA55_HOLLE|nr:Actin-related protein 2/3 complex subunit 3 [Holothuria leucospilota]